MAVFFLYPFNPPALHSHSQAHLSVRPLSKICETIEVFEGRRKGSSVRVLSTHSNAKILKPNRRSRYGQPLSPYDSSDDQDDDEEEEEEEEEDDDWLLDDEFAEPVDFEVDGKIFNSQKRKNERKGGKSLLDVRTRKNTPEKSIVGNFYHTKNKSEMSTVGNFYHTKNKSEKSTVGNFYHTKNRSKVADSLDIDSKAKLITGRSSENSYQKLSEEIDMDKKWIRLLDYLTTFGLKESHFVQMYERHMPSLQINVCSARERLDYLLSIGVKQRDIKRMLLRQPQLLEYTVESNLKSHVAFLMGLGIPNSRIGQIIATAPSLFSYSVENSLKPTVRYLVEEVGINEKNIGKVVQLSPQILVQRIDISWNMRYLFLSKEIGASRESVVKMVTKHPQLLHYSIDDGLLPRINFLRSIGMHNSDILKVLTSLTQVLSLSLEDNLKPKYMYLINELRNEVQSLTKYPMYLSLSLDQRIRPRHRFLVSLKKAPKGPFPLSSFIPTDESFCQQWAGTSLDKYLAFRQQLLLKEFAKKYERRG